MTEQTKGLPRRATLILSVLAAVVLAFSAYVVGVLTTSEKTPGDSSPEAGFARDMMTHHHQAIEMGMLAWRQGASEPVLVQGYDIATNQSDQVGQMRGWLKAWHLDPTGPDRAMAWMPDRLRAATGKNFDILFSQLMLRHHLGGIHMAEAILNLTDDPLVQDVAQKIKNAQSGEVEIFRKQLTELGSAPLP